MNKKMDKNAKRGEKINNEETNPNIIINNINLNEKTNNIALVNLRKKIDEIDDKILDNLNQRLELARQISRYKTNLRDSQREAEVKERVKIKAQRLKNLRGDFVLKLYSLIIKESLFLQGKKKLNKRR